LECFLLKLVTIDLRSDKKREALPKGDKQIDALHLTKKFINQIMNELRTKDLHLNTSGIDAFKKGLLNHFSENKPANFILNEDTVNEFSHHLFVVPETESTSVLKMFEQNINAFSPTNIFNKILPKAFSENKQASSEIQMVQIQPDFTEIPLTP